MKVAVLCPGYVTLPQFERTDEAHVIAVNRAVLHVPGRPDFWCFKDAHTFDWCIDDARFPRNPLPAILSTMQEQRKFCRPQRPPRRKGEPMPPPVHVRGGEFAWHFCENIKLPRKAWNWNKRSSWSAIAFAASCLKATEIVCVGMDWTGQKDWDGHHHPRQHRHDHRWDQERAEFRSAVGILAEIGCTLRRVEPQAQQTAEVAA